MQRAVPTAIRVQVTYEYSTVNKVQYCSTRTGDVWGHSTVRVLYCRSSYEYRYSYARSDGKWEMGRLDQLKTGRWSLVDQLQPSRPPAFPNKSCTVLYSTSTTVRYYLVFTRTSTRFGRQYRYSTITVPACSNPGYSIPVLCHKSRLVISESRLVPVLYEYAILKRKRFILILRIKNFLGGLPPPRPPAFREACFARLPSLSSFTREDTFCRTGERRIERVSPNMSEKLKQCTRK